MSTVKGSFNERSQYTTTYSGMRGVDLNASLKNAHTRFAYLENMYRDYDSEDGRIESIPGFRRIAELAGGINALFMQKTSAGERCIIAHAKDKLYRLRLDENNEVSDTEIIGTVNDSKSRAFTYGYDVYLLDGQRMWRIPEGESAIAVGEPGAMPYVPTTFNNGVEYEQRNLLTNRFKERTRLSATDTFTFGAHEI